MLAASSRRYLAADAFLEPFINDDGVLAGASSDIFKAMDESEHMCLRPFLAWQFSISAADLITQLYALGDQTCFNVLAVAMALVATVIIDVSGVVREHIYMIEKLAVRYKCYRLVEFGSLVALETRQVFTIAPIIAQAICNNAATFACKLIERFPNEWTFKFDMCDATTTVATLHTLYMHPRMSNEQLRAGIAESASRTLLRVVGIAALYDRGDVKEKTTLSKHAITLFTRDIIAMMNSDTSIAASAISGLARMYPHWHDSAGSMMLIAIASHMERCSTTTAITLLNIFRTECILVDPTITISISSSTDVAILSIASEETFSNSVKSPMRSTDMLSIALDRWAIQFHKEHPCPVVLALLELGAMWTQRARSKAKAYNYTIHGDEQTARAEKMQKTTA
jgi:hypothetical protein